MTPWTPAFSSVAEWVAMGQHGPYVWTCWGVTVLSILAVTLYLPHERRRFWRDEAARQRRLATRAHQARLTDPDSDASNDAERVP